MTEDRSRLSGLYAITDQDLIPERLFAEYVTAALKGGAGIIQYRDKSGERERRLQQAGLCKQLCDQHDAVFIINDDIGLCKQVGADGVHLGKDDDALLIARQSLGDEAIIGISCYDDMQRAIDAQRQGADYVAFGTMFSSPTKPDAPRAGPDMVGEAKKHDLQLPVCGIGGITLDNAALAIEQGADMIAVISTLFASKDIEGTARKLSGLFHQTS